MAKGAKHGKKDKRVKNPHLQARIAFLYQASKYLLGESDPNENEVTQMVHEANTMSTPTETSLPIQTEPASAEQTANTSERTDQADKDMGEPSKNADLSNDDKPAVQNGLQLLLAAHMREVARKGTLRIGQRIKRSLCRRCDALLLPGKTATTKIENKSRNGCKPWADVEVVTCTTCGAEKRFPVGSKRQKGKKERQKEKEELAKPRSSEHSAQPAEEAEAAEKT